MTDMRLSDGQGVIRCVNVGKCSKHRPHPTPPPNAYAHSKLFELLATRYGLAQQVGSTGSGR